MDLDAMRTLVREDLKDTDAAAYRWTDAVLDRHIERALREFAQASPRERKNDLATVAATRELDISSLAARLFTFAAEYPAGEFPPRYQRFSLYQDTLVFLGDDVPDGSNARIYWGSLHTLLTYSAWQAAHAYTLDECVQPATANGYYYRCSTAGTSAGSAPTWPTVIGSTVADNTAVWTCQGLTSTIPAEHENTVAMGAAAFALAEYAAYSVDRLSIGGEQTARRFREAADDRATAFRKELRRLKSRLCPSRLYTPVRPVESRATDWGP